MSSYRRYKKLNWFKRHPLLMRRSLPAFIVLAVFVAVFVLTTGTGVLPASPIRPSDVSLSSSQRVFTFKQKPLVLVRIHRAEPKTVSWLVGRAYADAELALLSSKVTNETGRPVGIPVRLVSTYSGQALQLDSTAATEPIRPGEYTIEATLKLPSGDTTTQKASFTWGVLAINTTQSIYAPGDTATIQMGALDSYGHTLCNAPLELTVVDPSGKSQVVPYEPSSSCRGDSYSSEPDYLSSYKTGGEGEYKMLLKIKDTDYSINDSFEVKAAAPFTVERRELTRIYPQDPYSVGLHITLHQDFKGTVTEVLDKGFQVLDAGGAVVGDGNSVTLAWQVDWKAGEVHDLSYRYKAPPVSPAFYYSGPLTFTDSSGQKVFREARQWQIAGDAGIAFVQKVSNIQGGGNPTSLTTSITTTAGDFLVIFDQFRTTSILDVSDTASNTWVLPPTDAPQDNGGSGSGASVAYVPDAAAITSVTVDESSTCSGSCQFGVIIAEFSGLAGGGVAAKDVQGNANGQTQSNHGQVTGFTTAANFCPGSGPTTDEELRGGNWFCDGVSQELLFNGIADGTATPTYNTTNSTLNSCNDLGSIQPLNYGRACYNILSAGLSNATVQWTLGSGSTTRWAAVSIAFKGLAAPPEQSLYWAQ